MHMRLERSVKKHNITIKKSEEIFGTFTIYNISMLEMFASVDT